MPADEDFVALKCESSETVSQVRGKIQDLAGNIDCFERIKDGCAYQSECIFHRNWFNSTTCSEITQSVNLFFDCLPGQKFLLPIDTYCDE